MPKKLKLEHKPLHCPVCSSRFMNVFGQPLPNHAQIRCLTANGDEMDIGICANCVEQGVTLEMVAAVLEGIKTYWDYEVDGNKTLTVDERAKRKAKHQGHQIATIKRIINTGKRAEKDARKRGKLL